MKIKGQKRLSIKQTNSLLIKKLKSPTLEPKSKTQNHQPKKTSIQGHSSLDQRPKLSINQIKSISWSNSFFRFLSINQSFERERTKRGERERIVFCFVLR